jgi:hypothetical protein
VRGDNAANTTAIADNRVANNNNAVSFNAVYANT